MSSAITTSKTLLTSILASLEALISQSSDQATSEQTPLNTQQQQQQQQQQPFYLNSLTSTIQKPIQSILLTLHFLFPHELLPALDLIDRGLITHLHTPTTGYSSTTTPSQPTLEIYYVQSASAVTTTITTSTSTSTTSSSTHPHNSGPPNPRQKAATGGRFRNALNSHAGRSGSFYEVHIDSWNCSCPAFAYSCLRLLSRDSGSGSGTGAGIEHDRKVDNGLGRGQGEKKSLDWLMGGTATKDHATMPICKHILAVALIKAAPGMFGDGMIKKKVASNEIAGWAAGWDER